MENRVYYHIVSTLREWNDLNTWRAENYNLKIALTQPIQEKTNRSHERDGKMLLRRTRGQEEMYQLNWHLIGKGGENRLGQLRSYNDHWAKKRRNI